MSHNPTFSLATFVSAALCFVPLLTAETVVSAGSASVSTGDLFTLPVSITGGSDVYAFQLDLSFDPAVLTLLNISEGTFLPSAGSTIFAPGAIDNVGGTASGTADTLVGSIPGASGAGVLVDFTFQAISQGASALDISNGILLDSNLNDIPFTTAAGNVTVTAATTGVPEPAGLSWIGGLLVAAMLWGNRRAKSRPAEITTGAP